MRAVVARSVDPRPLIVHVVFRFDYGGLENGVVNLVNGLPENAFRHVIVALSQASGFANRIWSTGVQVHELNKRPGHDPAAYLRLFRLLKSLRPAIVHTRNLGTLEGALVARLAGAPCRIHGEHGWDVHDVDGASRRYRAMRKLINPVIDRFVAVSRELERWLTGTVGISPSKVVRICNGVDTARFTPAGTARDALRFGRFPRESLVVGSVTRFSEIKDPLNLVRAFIAARGDPEGGALRLVMVGDGPLKPQAERLLRDAGAADAAWLPGSRDDVPEMMRAMDVFVLSSRREGISNTILEAMASGLPVVATATGGNPELVLDGVTGQLVPPSEPAALARALVAYACSATARAAHGRAARARAEREYSLGRMVADYEALYREHCVTTGEAA
ncbi:MAG: TIGR03088 family PEP-CTERM/XrtA system glycosyltransferase [Gammaproteobacteria bacterium]